MQCRVCNRNIRSTEVKFQLNNRKFNTPISFVQCDGCMCYCCVELDKNAHDDTYKSNDSWRFQSKQEYQKNYELRENRQQKLNKKIVKYLKSSLNLNGIIHADMACAEGVFVEQMNAAGAASIGVDIDPSATDWGKQKKRPLYNESLFDSSRGPFDVVSIHEALDHMPSVHTAIERLKANLKPNGILTVVNTIYNMPHEVAKNKFHHSSYFNLPGLLNVIKQHGFSITHEHRLPLPGKWPQKIRNPRFKSKHLIIAKLG